MCMRITTPPLVPATFLSPVVNFINVNMTVNFKTFGKLSSTTMRGFNILFKVEWERRENDCGNSLPAFPECSTSQHLISYRLFARDRWHSSDKDSLLPFVSGFLSRCRCCRCCCCCWRSDKDWLLCVQPGAAFWLHCLEALNRPPGNSPSWDSWLARQCWWRAGWGQRWGGSRSSRRLLWWLLLDCAILLFGLSQTTLRTQWPQSANYVFTSPIFTTFVKAFCNDLWSIQNKSISKV